MTKSPQMLIELVSQALGKGITAEYLLFDSWFAFPGNHEGNHEGQVLGNHEGQVLKNQFIFCNQLQLNLLMLTHQLNKFRCIDNLYTAVAL